MIRKEGFPYIAVTLILGLIFYFILFKPIAVGFVILSLFFLYFFRDPERIPPEDPNVVVCPADGRIISIKQNQQSICSKDYIEISIFMSPFDVHVNRAPFEGTVKEVIYTPGKFFSAFKEKAYRENENIKIIIKTKHGDIILRQVAGFIARRAVCWIKEGDNLKKGQRIGMIKFSSRVDICLPSFFKISVKVGDKVKAGKDIIAYI